MTDLESLKNSLQQINSVISEAPPLNRNDSLSTNFEIFSNDFYRFSKNFEEYHKNSEELRKNFEEHNKIFEEQRKIFKEHNKNFEEQRKNFKEHHKNFDEHQKSDEKTNKIRTACDIGIFIVAVAALIVSILAYKNSVCPCPSQITQKEKTQEQQPQYPAKPHE